MSVTVDSAAYWRGIAQNLALVAAKARQQHEDFLEECSCEDDPNGTTCWYRLSADEQEARRFDFVTDAIWMEMIRLGVTALTRDGASGGATS